MNDLPGIKSQTLHVASFQELVSTPFDDCINAIGWIRPLTGDFSEIAAKLRQDGNITVLEEQDLSELELSDEGHLAREMVLNDLRLLTAHGASPSLNLISHYDRDESFPLFPTDVYSFHVDRAPVPTDTFLCTYHGATSEILPHAQAEQAIHIPEIREALKQLYDGPDEGFLTFLNDHFFDLHYRAKDGATPISLGQGHLWRLAVDHPESKALPCIHRAPNEKPGQKRLLLIC